MIITIKYNVRNWIVSLSSVCVMANTIQRRNTITLAQDVEHVRKSRIYNYDFGLKTSPVSMMADESGGNLRSVTLDPVKGERGKTRFRDGKDLKEDWYECTCALLAHQAEMDAGYFKKEKTNQGVDNEIEIYKHPKTASLASLLVASNPTLSIGHSSTNVTFPIPLSEGKNYIAAVRTSVEELKTDFMARSASGWINTKIDQKIYGLLRHNDYRERFSIIAGKVLRNNWMQDNELQSGISIFMVKDNKKDKFKSYGDLAFYVWDTLDAKDVKDLDNQFVKPDTDSGKKVLNLDRTKDATDNSMITKSASSLVLQKMGEEKSKHEQKNIMSDEETKHEPKNITSDEEEPKNITSDEENRTQTNETDPWFRPQMRLMPYVCIKNVPYWMVIYICKNEDRERKLRTAQVSAANEVVYKDTYMGTRVESDSESWNHIEQSSLEVKFSSAQSKFVTNNNTLPSWIQGLGLENKRISHNEKDFCKQSKTLLTTVPQMLALQTVLKEQIITDTPHIMRLGRASWSGIPQRKIDDTYSHMVSIGHVHHIKDMNNNYCSAIMRWDPKAIIRRKGAKVDSPDDWALAINSEWVAWTTVDDGAFNTMRDRHVSFNEVEI